MKLFKNVFIFLLAGIIGVIGGFGVTVGLAYCSGDYPQIRKYSKASQAELEDISYRLFSMSYSVSDISTDDEKRMIFLVSSGEKSIDVTSDNLNARITFSYNSEGRVAEVLFTDNVSAESEVGAKISEYGGLLNFLDTFYDNENFNKLLELFDASKLSCGSNSIYEISVPTDAYSSYRNSEAVTVRYELQNSNSGYTLIASVSVQMPT